MFRLTVKIAVFVVGILVLAGAFIYWYDSAGQRADTDFDTRVANPAYRDSHPRVLFDVAHNNYHAPSGRYGPFASLLQNDGYDITLNTKPFTMSDLDSSQVLIIANAMGPDNYEGRPAFSKLEDSLVAAWVHGGGSLLLVADHVPFGSAAAELANQFGIEMFLAFARDDENSEWWDNERLIFSSENGLLADCPIISGRTPAEQVRTVNTFTGQSLSVPPDGIAVLRMSDDSYDWQSRSIRHTAKEHAQCVALEFGEGRLVVLGEAGVLSAQVDPLGFKMGMNHPGSDDRQFALNVMHWLSRELP